MFLKTTTSRLMLGIATLGLPIAIAFFTSGFFVWSPLNCWHEDVDLNSGRVRRTKYLLYCQTAERIEETWLSRAVNASHDAPDWRHVNTFSPGVRHSPHYHFHGAIHQIRTLEQAVGILPLDAEARQQVAKNVLSIWKETQSYTRANDYVDGVFRAALEKVGSPIITVADLPRLPEQ